MGLQRRIFDGKILAILTGGGDTPSLNASIEALKCRASVLGYKVYGIRKGWKGLLGDGDIVDISNQPYDGIYGGTALRTTRTNPFPTLKNPIDRTDEILRNIRRYGIDVLVTVGGDDTISVSKKLFEQVNIPVIAFPNTIDNDIKTGTMHNYNGEELETAFCPGFPSAAKGIAEFTSRICTTAESHSRVMVIEVMGKNSGWLTGAGMMGGAEISLIPEFPVTMEKKERFFETVIKVYNSIKKKYLVIAVGEGTKWYDEKTGKAEVVHISKDTDEFENPRYGGISTIIAAEIERSTGIQARAQTTSYYARSGECRKYDKRLCGLLADKMIDVLLREDYGKMIVLNKLSTYQEIEEYNTGTINLKEITCKTVPGYYYDPDNFHFNEKYYDFISYFVEKPKGIYFNYNFPRALTKV
ncbi:MAG: 6-phosphofructokinase [Bacteroidia bacterium]|nr:6-phosphofructokinase [Bacteroidia bacterium]